MKKKRFIMIGDDGMTLSLVKKFKDELPNIRKLMECGASLAAVSSCRVDTPTIAHLMGIKMRSTDGGIVSSILQAP